MNNYYRRNLIESGSLTEMIADLLTKTLQGKLF